MKKILMATAAFMTLGGLMDGAAQAISITASVTGDPNPPTVTASSLQVGDLRLRNDYISVTLLGDGMDETIRWDFDFSSDPNVQNFLDDVDVVTSALYTFTVKPTNFGITTDVTGIPGVQGIRIPDLPGMPSSGQVGTVTIDLVDFGFDPNNILTQLQQSPIIPWYWQDDVILSSAQLELIGESSQPVPEPASVLGLLAVGALGAVSLRKRSRK